MGSEVSKLMTHVWNINCHKWRNVGLIGTWVLVTVLLAYTIYGLYNTSTIFMNNSCWLNHYTNLEGQDKVTKTCVDDGGIFLYAEYIFLIGLNGLNVFIMWYVINRKYKILKVNCTSNERHSTITEVPTTFTSNEEYFKNKENVS